MKRIPVGAHGAGVGTSGKSGGWVSAASFRVLGNIFTAGSRRSGSLSRDDDEPWSLVCLPWSELLVKIGMRACVRARMAGVPSLFISHLA